MYDEIVVGARCAGATTAMLLARKGHRVLFVDRARFPSDIPHGHFIHREGPARLKRWGLLDSIVGSNCPAVSSQVMDMGDFPLRVDGLSVNGVAWGYGPRRKVLDQILVDAAVESGAEFQDGFLVEEFVSTDGRVTGIRGRTREGRVTTAEAKLTIGADGRNSRLARAVSAVEYDVAPTLLCYYFSYWESVPHEPFEFYRRDRRVIFSFSTNDDLFAVFIGVPIEEHHSVRSNIEANFLSTLDLVPDLAERVRGGNRVEPFYGAADLPNFYRKPYGEGWALVGDAGYHKDPYLALGMADALRDAELLTDAVDEAVAGTRPFDDALSDYECKRNEASHEEYSLNLGLAQLGSMPPDALALRAAVRTNVEDARRFAMAQYGMIPREEFFNPENLGRLMGQAPPRA